MKGAWSTKGSDCMTLDRPGTHAQAGNLSLCASSEGGAVSLEPSFCTAHELAELWSEFKAAGTLCAGRPHLAADAAPMGAAAVTMTIPAGGKLGLRNSGSEHKHSRF